MTTLQTALVCFAMMEIGASGQGWFLFDNPGAPTRIGTIDGPLAGPGIWAHMLAGSTADSLTPVGLAAEHWGQGRVAGDPVQVPGIPSLSTGMVQMVVWDGRIWGTVLADVPWDQLGRTDAVPVWLNDPPPGLSFPPRFTRPAIVPIPEPSVWALGALGGGLLLSLRARSRWRAAAYARINADSQHAATTTADSS